MRFRSFVVVKIFPWISIVSLLSIFIGIYQANAQVEPLLSEKFAIHPKIGFGFTGNSSNFHNFQGTVDCGLFQKGSGSGVTGFIFGEYPISPSVFIGMGIGYTDRSSTLTVPGSFASYDATSQTITAVTTENSIHATLGYLELQPEFRFSLIPNFISGPLRAVGAARFFIPMSGSFVQNETIVSPENAAFISTGKREQTRLVSSGQIKTLAPLGIIVPPAPPPPLPPPPPPKPVLALELSNVKAELHTGNEIVASSALVNVIFFNQKSAEIPSKYKTNKSDVLPTQSDPVKNHEYVVSHIASILRSNPKSTVILEGATSGADDEPEGIELAKLRTESVSRVLVNFGVNPDRITTRSSLLPRNPSNQEFPEGRIENRRVDITILNAPLQEYVSRRQVTEVNGTASATITSKNIPDGEHLTLNSNCIENSINVNASTEITIPLKCKISNEQTEFTFTAEVSSPSIKATAEQTVPITKLPIRQVDLKVDNFEGILRFEYNSSELTQPNKELLRQMLEPLPPGTSITIYGSADALGTGQRNLQLSEERAKNTEEFIHSLSGNKFNITTATQTEKFPENTPEGRFLNRSMRIRLVK
ncbi:MAG: OmpA family protein [Ignavibacteriae bacterium]|nr:OmpA family protein [Ignavibacteriota bacterium]